MDKLLLAATYYELFLLNRDFHLIAGDSKRNKLEFDIIFREEHFRHLIGFDKLKDIAEAKNREFNLYENVLNGNITYEYITKSDYIADVIPRIDYFLEIREALFAKKIMIGKVDEHTFCRIKADYLLTKDLPNGIVNLFLKLAKPNLAVPMSFFKTDFPKYHGKSWTILDRIESTNNNIKAYANYELSNIKKKILTCECEVNELNGSFIVYNGEIYNIISCIKNYNDVCLKIKNHLSGEIIEEYNI